MPTHAERRIVAYSPAQMYDLVADIKRYPEFLPWCISVVEKSRTGNVIEADMAIGFKALREQFTSRVTLESGRAISVEYLNGPFRYLKNHWVFHDHPQGCEIEFFIDFEFRSRLLQMVIGTLFNEAVRIMVRAFETRATRLYGRAK